jgi:hypothetical protein
VVRAALQDAASVAGLLVTTAAMVAELPKDAPAMPAMLGGGGIGGSRSFADFARAQSKLRLLPLRHTHTQRRIRREHATKFGRQ